MRWLDLTVYGFQMFAMQRLTDAGEERRLHTVGRIRSGTARRLVELGFVYDGQADQYVRDLSDGFRVSSLQEIFVNAKETDLPVSDVLIVVDQRTATIQSQVEAYNEAPQEVENHDYGIDRRSFEDSGSATTRWHVGSGGIAVPADGEQRTVADEADEGGALASVPGSAIAAGNNRDADDIPVGGTGHSDEALADKQRGTSVEEPAKRNGFDRPDATAGFDSVDSGRNDAGGDGRSDFSSQGSDVLTPEESEQSESVKAPESPAGGVSPVEQNEKSVTSERNADNFRLLNLLDLEFEAAFNVAKRAAANLDAIEVLYKRKADAGGMLPNSDREAMAKYVGWGGLARIIEGVTLLQPAVDENQRNALMENKVSRNMTAAEATQVDRMDRMVREGTITKDDFRSFSRSTLSAHFTHPKISRALWAAVKHMGFDGGRAIEPGCGTGNFIGTVPDDLRPNVEFHGVELDSTTAGIASRLYPGAYIANMGFEKFRARTGSYSLAIGNVPFGNFSVSDPDYDKYRLNIHNHFLLKSLDLVQEGGVVALLTSTFTMDAGSSNVRRLLASKGELVGAIRLPQKALSKNANTDVSVDMLFFRRADNPDVMTLPDEDLPLWAQSGVDMNVRPENAYPEDYKPVYVSRYFVERPDMVIGEIVESTGQFGKTFVAHLEDMDSFDERLEKALSSLPKAIYAPVNGPFAQVDESDDDGRVRLFDQRVDQYRIGSYIIGPDGDPLIIENITDDGEIVSVPVEPGTKLSEGQVPKSRIKDLLALIAIRDAVVDVLNTQSTFMEDTDEVLAARERLNSLYDAFVAKNGPIQLPKNARLFGQDPQSNLIYAIEKFNAETGEASKNDIFHGRVVHPPVIPEAAQTAEEALQISLAFYGEIRPKQILRLLGMQHETGDEIKAGWRNLVNRELSGLVFQDPVDGRWLTAGQYLSGNIKSKIDEATRFVNSDPSFEANIKALREALPSRIPAEDIAVQMSAPWLEVGTIREFVAGVCGIKPDHPGLDVCFEPITNRWLVSLPQISGVGMTQERADLSTDARDFVKLVQAKLNRTKIRVKVKGRDGGEYVDEKATLAAIAKADVIETKFRHWLWADPDRCAHYVEIYNDRYNSYVRMKADGSHLTFPGMNPVVSLRGHQKDAPWFAISQGNCLFAHEVGTGKTYSMIASLMEMSRLGRARRPFLVVKKSTLDQIAGSARHLYPSAHIITIDGSQLNKETRGRFLSRLATENYDLAVMSHETFQKIGLSQQTEERYIRAMLDQLRVAVQELIDQDDSGGRSFNVKQAEGFLARAEAKLDKLIERRKKNGVDNLVTIEQIAPGAVAYDEAQALKNMEVSSNTPGLANQGSDRSNIALMMFRALEALNPDFVRILSSGTPISNSFSEVFGLFRFLAPETLHDMTGSVNEYSIDPFAGQFIQVETKVELGVEGTYKERDRLRVVSLPELMSAMHFMDVRFADDLGIPRPALRRKVVTAKPSLAQQILKFEIADRALAIKGRLVEPSVDNYLKLSTDGRKGATDARLINPLLPDHPGSKINLAVIEIKKRYDKYQSFKGTQAVFLDQGVPKDNPNDQVTINLYADIKTKLIASGIPAHEIAFIHDAKTDAQRGKLFDAINAGNIRVIIGSTEKMGVGTNMQERMVAGHHIDPPAAMRPADMEQRDGRFFRQGNMSESVESIVYTTEGSFDLYVFQLMEAKRKVIHAVLRGDRSIRQIDEEGGMDSYDDIMAATTNDPSIAEKIRAEAELSRLISVIDDHERTVARARYTLKLCDSNRASMEATMGALQAMERIREESKLGMSAEDIAEGRFWEVSIHESGRLTSPLLAYAIFGAECGKEEVGQIVRMNGDELRKVMNKTRGVMLKQMEKLSAYQQYTVRQSFAAKLHGLPAEISFVPLEHVSGFEKLDKSSRLEAMCKVEVSGGNMLRSDSPKDLIGRFSEEKTAYDLDRIRVRMETNEVEAEHQLGLLESRNASDIYEQLAKARKAFEDAQERAAEAINRLREERDGLPYMTLREYLEVEVLGHGRMLGRGTSGAAIEKVSVDDDEMLANYRQASKAAKEGFSL